ncbi:MAG: C39 family peptidase, partial [Microgenomates group bacterium]
MNKLFFSTTVSVILFALFGLLSPTRAAETTYSLSEIWKGYGTNLGYFDFPVDVFVDSDERVLVADYSNNRIQIFNQNAQVLSAWTGFKNPEKIAQGHDGNFYIADTNNHRIVKLDKNGEYITAWSGKSGPNFFPRGVGVAVSPDNYVYSVHAIDYIEKFDSFGNPVTSWGTNGVLNVPGTLEAVRVDSQGYVYVIANDSVMKFSPQGIRLAQWGTFNGAQDLFIDQNDNIFVTNTYKGRIEKYSKDGQLLTMFGEGILNVPHGTGVDRRGRVYVADARNHRVVVFTPSAPPPFILNVPLIKQTDQLWANAPYDHAASQSLTCGKTIKECGCALTSLAMLLNFHGVTKDPEGKPTTPATLNNYFNKDAQCVSSGCVSQGYVFGDVLWSAADRYSADAYKKFGTQKIVSLNSANDAKWDKESVANDIKNNQPVIIKVEKNEHWALAVGIDQETFVLNDPLRNVDRLNS